MTTAPGSASLMSRSISTASIAIVRYSRLGRAHVSRQPAFVGFLQPCHRYGPDFGESQRGAAGLADGLGRHAAAPGFLQDRLDERAARGHQITSLVLAEEPGVQRDFGLESWVNARTDAAGHRHLRE